MFYWRFSVAWYVADANASVTNAAAATGTLSVGETTSSVANDFTITPSAISTPVSLQYTDAAGKTYVSIPNGDGTYSVKEGTAGTRIASYVLKATVTYSGDAADQAAVEALWASTVADVTLTLTCTATGGSTVSGSASTSDVKFVTAADNFTEKASGNTFTKTDDQFEWSSKTTTAELTFGTVYVALRGSNSLIVDADHLPTYTLSLAATHTLVS